MNDKVRIMNGESENDEWESKNSEWESMNYIRGSYKYSEEVRIRMENENYESEIRYTGLSKKKLHPTLAAILTYFLIIRSY